MSEYRSALARVAIGALAVSSLVLGGLASPASALDEPNDVTLEQSAPDPTVDPQTDPDRCASSRGNGDCDDDDEPIVDPVVEVTSTTTTTTTTAPVTDPGTTVAGGGDQTAVPAPVEQVVSDELEQNAPVPAPAASLPRTGSSIGLEVTLAFALIGAGITILRLARRRRPVNQG